MIRARALSSAVVVVICVVSLLTASAAQGKSSVGVDKSFGKKGVANLTAIRGDGIALAQVPGGTLVGVGESVVRVDSSGSQDSSFGTSGVATVPEGVRSVSAYTSGPLAGRFLPYSGPASSVFRYAAEGQLDTSFPELRFVDGSNGPYFFGAPIAYPAGPTEKFLMSRSEPAPGFGTQAIRIERRNADGSLDTSFATGGTFTSDVGLQSFDPIPYPSSSKQAGKVLIPVGQPSLYLRVTADGQLDKSFGRGGVLRVKNGVGRFAAFYPNGEMLFSGFAPVGADLPDATTLSRLTDDGKLDKRFGQNGTAKLVTQQGENGYEYASPARLALITTGRHKGQIVGAGEAASIRIRSGELGGRSNVAIFAFTEDGQLDKGFGRGGALTRVPGVKLQPEPQMLASERGALIAYQNKGVPQLLRFK